LFRPDIFGVVESRDLKQVLDQLEERGLIAGEVGVMGVSYGASVAIEWAAIDARIHAIVALEPFATLEDVSIDAAPLVLGRNRWLYSDNDIRDALQKAGKMAGFNPADASPLAAMPKVRAPVLLFHSKDDEFIPFRHSVRLSDAGADTLLLPVEKQSHFMMWWYSRDMIALFARAWLNKYLAHEPIAPATTQARSDVQ
jgi:pimeloyl-ACP methyl ester carboxylesterase